MAGGNPPNRVVEWWESQKGQPLLSIDGYFFTNSGNGKTPGVRYWKCSAFKTHDCPVSSKTIGANVMTLNGVLNPPDHGHINADAQARSLDVRVGV